MAEFEGFVSSGAKIIADILSYFVHQLYSFYVTYRQLPFPLSPNFMVDYTKIAGKSKYYLCHVSFRPNNNISVPLKGALLNLIFYFSEKNLSRKFDLRYNL